MFLLNITENKPVMVFNFKISPYYNFLSINFLYIYSVSNISSHAGNIGMCKLTLTEISVIVHRGGRPSGNKVMASFVESHGSYLYMCLKNGDFNSLDKFLIARIDITPKSRVSLYTPHFDDYVHKFQISSLYVLMFVYAGLSGRDKKAFVFI